MQDPHGPARLLPRLALVGGALLVAAGAVLIGRPEAVTVADAVPSASPVPPTAAPVRVTPPPSPSASPVPTASTLPSGAAASPPVRVTVRAPRVTARVVPVLADRTGALELPADPATFGWWAPGAAPSATTGTVVLAAHVDAVGYGAGPMSRLARAPMGTRITVTDARGAAVTYRLDGRRTIAKAALPADLFRLDGAPRLVLVTCGGPFDRATGHYRDNVVLVASPVPAGD